MKKTLSILLGLLPQNKISNLIGNLSKTKLTKLFIPLYIKIYNIDTSNVIKDVQKFKSINDFFTRKINPESRPFDLHENIITSPVDGTISEFGEIQNGTLIQAKGKHYTVEQLVGNAEQAKKFQNGKYLTIYLSPSDYHRIHMPCTGRITKTTFIPGNLFPVNSIGTNYVEGLFTKNERVITTVEHKKELAIVKVGAFIVGSVQVNYLKELDSLHEGKIYSKDFSDTNLIYQKGQELGYFQFGSTVILLFEENSISFINLFKNQKVFMGETIGKYTS